MRKCISAKFPWLVIDEYQDLGKPLHEMVMALFTQTDIKIFVVGDPDQSIYGFSGAIPDYLMELYNRKIQYQLNCRTTIEAIRILWTVQKLYLTFHVITMQ